ncbi:REP-associated tyrosine transposase [Marinobacter bohaiensis]|uniref:REP-associated tyrosine transposase n=1 Tax=Marinobacter bohaiensis TaxID=2201898 RepID=UPI000DACF394|nr:transposase [Marinobacter bohaiensis]
MSYKEAVRHRQSVIGQEYLITICLQDRQPLFQHFDLARAVVHAFRKMEAQAQASVLAWVVMPDHLHALISLSNPKGLGNTVAHFKIDVSRCASRRIPWQKGFHERTLRKADDRKDIARYIILNPVRAGLVASVREYPHWDSVYL